jgi:hypothetical protein
MPTIRTNDSSCAKYFIGMATNVSTMSSTPVT